MATEYNASSLRTAIVRLVGQRTKVDAELAKLLRMAHEQPDLRPGMTFRAYCESVGVEWKYAYRLTGIDKAGLSDWIAQVGVFKADVAARAIKLGITPSIEDAKKMGCLAFEQHVKKSRQEPAPEDRITALKNRIASLRAQLANCEKELAELQK